jgi:hypothetical protein
MHNYKEIVLQMYFTSCRHFNWSSGSLLFEYLRYDRVPYGSAGDLGNFQVCLLLELESSGSCCYNNCLFVFGVSRRLGKSR